MQITNSGCITVRRLSESYRALLLAHAWWMKWLQFFWLVERVKMNGRGMTISLFSWAHTHSNWATSLEAGAGVFSLLLKHKLWVMDMFSLSTRAWHASCSWDQTCTLPLSGGFLHGQISRVSCVYFYNFPDIYFCDIHLFPHFYHVSDPSDEPALPCSQLRDWGIDSCVRRKEVLGVCFFLMSLWQFWSLPICLPPRVCVL